MCLNSDRRTGSDLRYNSHCACWYSLLPSSVSILTGVGSHASGGRPPTFPPPLPTAVSGTLPCAVRSYGDALMSCTRGWGGGEGQLTDCWRFSLGGVCCVRTPSHPLLHGDLQYSSMYRVAGGDISNEGRVPGDGAPEIATGAGVKPVVS